MPESEGLFPPVLPMQFAGGTNFFVCSRAKSSVTGGCRASEAFCEDKPLSSSSRAATD